MKYNTEKFVETRTLSECFHRRWGKVDQKDPCHHVVRVIVNIMV